jgi:hypothetical protein
MSFNKYGEANKITLENAESCIPSVSPEILKNFQKFAANLKKVAPRAEDFLYFSAVMMHAAEAAALNDDGTPKINANGEVVTVGWDKTGDTWRWVSNDPNVKPYKNSNGDIFPEEELVKAHKKWVHKPLCIDHKSSSVDHVRGFIVDTYYDRKLKRVIALCALDKAGYPQLARNVATGISNCVSMGTAVGRAICTECARVARSEADFCTHMRNKTAYGEINVDLNPIELSIVMNGADSKATIKHVLAAANTLNTYVENKQRELAKLADLKFNANITVTDEMGNEGPQNTSVSIESNDIEKFKADLAEAMEKLQSLYASVKNSEENTNSSALNQSSGTIAMDDGVPTDSGLALQTPQTERFASVESAEIIELRKVTAAIEAKLEQMKQSLDKLAKTSINTQEENMTGSKEFNKKGYFQGAGGVNEPTPGQVKYPKDPLNEQLRDHEDKQMVGQPPFPEVGPVDGMHPSPESVDPSDELQRKKMLARAEAEERAMRRQAIVNLAKAALENKQAYFQGGGGVNEPTPGKAKYPKDKLNEELRDYEDKQMVGQPPFPGVGPVDGLHPSPSSADPKDELKRKQMLARANTLRARFVKAAKQDGTRDLGNSAWEVFLGDKLLLTASVNELTGGRPELFYDNIATEQFGVKLIERIKAYGSSAVAKLIKKGQPAPAGAGAPPAGAGAPPAGGDMGAPAGGDMGAPPAGGDMGAPAGGKSVPLAVGPDTGPSAKDTGKSGDPKQTAMELSEKVRDLSSDLVEAVRALTGEQAEMDSDEGGAGGLADVPAVADNDFSSKKLSASFSTATLNTLRKELNGALTHAMKEAVAELNDHKQELDMIVGLYDRGGVTEANADSVGILVEDALNEAKTAIADGFKLMTAFVKYVRGTKAIIKRAEIEAELQALAADKDSKDFSSAEDGDLMDLISDTNADLDAVKSLVDGDDDMGDESDDLEDMKDLGGLSPDDADDDDAIVEVKTPQEAAMVTKENPQAHVRVASLDTREGRAALRAKLAADALGKEDDGEVQDMSKQKFSDMLEQADRLADGQTDLDVKPSDSLGLVETPEERNKAMMEVAKAPPKVRKEAEAIQKLVSEGALDPADLDALVAEGLDKDAVAYWKKYYGQTEGGSEFANELVKEHVKAQLEEQLNTYRIKLARAYELAYDMVDRGLCNADRASISLQVDEIMKFDDPSFESLKRVVARHPVIGMQKSAGRLPLVGLRGYGDPQSTAEAAVEEDAYVQLSSMLGTKKGYF